MRRTILMFTMLFYTIGIFAQEQRFLTSDGVDIYLKVKGEGTPCLYIHGGPGAGSYWMEKFAGDILEKRFQMIYLDLRGVSRSTSPSDNNYSIDRMVKDFEEIRLALGIKEWIIMGHSFSGTIEMGYALKHPKSIKGMMMFNCVLDINECMTKAWIPHACKIVEIEDLSYFNNDSIPTQTKLDTLFSLLNDKDLSWKMAYREKENEKIMNATFKEIPNWNNDFGKVAFSIEDYKKNFKPFCPEVEIPVLYFYGKSDWMIGPEHYKGINFPEMMLWGSNVGHMPFMENKPDLEKAIDSFLIKYKL